MMRLWPPMSEERVSSGQATLAREAEVGREWIIHLEKAGPTVELGLVMGTLKASGVRLSVEPRAQVDSAIDLSQILGESHNSKSHCCAPPSGRTSSPSSATT